MLLVKKQLRSLIVLTTKTAQLVLIRDATPSLTWKGNLLFFNFPHPLLNLISTLLLQGTLSFLILLSFISFFFWVQFFSSYQATYHLGIVTNANIRCFLYAFYVTFFFFCNYCPDWIVGFILDCIICLLVYQNVYFTLIKKGVVPVQKAHSFVGFGKKK